MKNETYETKDMIFESQKISKMLEGDTYENENCNKNNGEIPSEGLKISKTMEN